LLNLPKKSQMPKKKLLLSTPVLFYNSAMKIFLRIILGCVFALSASAQTESARTIRDATPVNYSESKSYQPREFPARAKSKAKKEKKPKKNEEAANESPVITANVSPKTDGTITIPVSVFGADRRFVANLKQSDFKIFADGEEQEIISTEQRDEPVNLILLIDTSPSTAFRIEEIQAYALSLVERLKPEDKAMIISFDEQTRVGAELTADRVSIAKAIKKLKFGDGTSLYEAVKKTFDKHVSGISGRTAVVLLTDAVDTTSLKATYADSLAAAERTDAAVFPIYFDTFGGSDPKAAKNNPQLQAILRTLIQGSAQGVTAAEYELGKFYLNDISRLSGGRPRAVKDIKTEIVENIGAELRTQYQVRFRPTNFAAGQRKQLTVRVNRPNLLVQARGSYIVGESGAAK
jgi:VWFA-related protein